MMPDSQRAILELENVSMNYEASNSSFSSGVHHVLDSVSIKLLEGETLGLIGNNGCGKTRR